jgi:beta-mannosidase
MNNLMPTLVLVLGFANATCAGNNWRTQVRAKHSLPLMAGWKFRAAGQNMWYPAEVPGCVHTDLLRNKLIEDPFSANNEEKLQWIGKTFWSYQTTLSVDPELLSYDNVELAFEGLDTYARIFSTTSLF